MALSNTAFGLGSTINQVNITGTSPEAIAALIRQHEDYSETQKKLIVRLENDLDLNVASDSRRAGDFGRGQCSAGTARREAR